MTVRTRWLMTVGMRSLCKNGSCCRSCRRGYRSALPLKVLSRWPASELAAAADRACTDTHHSFCRLEKDQNFAKGDLVQTLPAHLAHWVYG